MLESTIASSVVGTEDEVDAAQIGGGHETGHVAHYTAAQAQDCPIAAEAGGQQPVIEVAHGVERLVPFAGGHGQDGERRETEFFGKTRFLDSCCVKRPDVTVGDEGRLVPNAGQGDDLGQQVVADDDIIATAGVLHRDGLAQAGGDPRGDGDGHVIRRAAAGVYDREPGIGRGPPLQKRLDASFRIDAGQEGPAVGGRGHPADDHVRLGRETKYRAGRPQHGGVGGVKHEPAAGGDDQPAPLGQFGGDLRFQITEVGLAGLVEDVGD